jgi:hypothetical protein
MSENITIQGAQYPDVPKILVPRTPSTVIAETSVTVNQSFGIGCYYGTMRGSTRYNYPELVVTYDGTTYTLPLDPDPSGYAEGYLGYGATYTTASSMDFSVYPIRVEDDDGGGSWRLYNATGGTHTVKVMFAGQAAFVEPSETTAVPSDVASGKKFYDASGNLTLGTAGSDITLAMRPDAELIQSWSDDYLVHEDRGVTIPSYSTTAATLITSANLSPLISTDSDNYDYIVITRTLTIPIYSTTTAVKGRVEYHASCVTGEYGRFAAGTFKSINGSGKKYTTTTTQTMTSAVMGRLIYWSSTSAITAYSTVAYGTYQTPQAITSGATAITVKSPAVAVRGHTTYFTSGAWANLTDIRCQYVIDLYRVPKDALGQHGFFYQSGLINIANCAQSDNHKLV